MQYSIDEIYDLFVCDAQLSDEEYDARVQKGIDAAKQIKNLFPFMQPIILPPEKSKSVWEPCATVIVMRSDEELQPFIFQLLQWIADPNWPGALLIYNRLTQMQYTSIESALHFSRTRAERENDSGWLSMLDDLNQDMITGQNRWMI